MEWYLAALRKYADFNGRARRREYWLFSLFTTLIYIALILFALLAAGLAERSDNHHSGILALLFVPAYLYLLAMIVPGIAVTVRRLHDTGRSGWMYLIAFLPIIGGIIVFVFTVLDSEPGPNLYGPSPKYGQVIPPYYPVPPQGY